MKRTIAILLSLFLLLGIFTVGTFAASEAEVITANATAAEDDEPTAPDLPYAPSGLSQMIMNALLTLPNLLSPGWADGVVDTLVFFSEVVPPPFNWLLIWFIRAL